MIETLRRTDVIVESEAARRPPLDLAVDTCDTQFIAIDVETANANISSICQIAAVSFVGSRAVKTWQSLLNPRGRFEPFNVALHGIDTSAVERAPCFPDIFPKLSVLLTGRVVASHMAFDRVALERACLKYELPQLECKWLDTARVCRRAWPQFARRGYGLKSIASWCGFEFRHHDAFEDARVAGSILARAVAETGVDIPEWIRRTTPAARITQDRPRVGQFGAKLRLSADRLQTSQAEPG